MRLIDADALLKALNDYGLSYRADINGMIMQAPTIAPSGDLVSRQDVIEALCRSSVYAWSIEQDQTAHNWALNIINALPSADAVHGEWIPCDLTFGRSIWACSVCDNGSYVPCDEFTQKPIYDYCP